MSRERQRCQHFVQSIMHEGVYYEIFCQAEGAVQFTNGWYCAKHRPSVVHRGVVDPAPDPAMTAAALQAQARPAYAAREYGLPADPPDVEVRKVRVLKAHRDAVTEVMADAAAIITAGGMDQFVEVMASAVLSAGDSNVWWVVGVRVPGEHPLIFGPYSTPEAAQKAIDGGHIPAHVEGCQAWIFPMHPAPKSKRKASSKKKAPAESAE